MKTHARDEFKHYNLPFKTFFNPCTNHEEVTHDEMEFIWVFEGEVTITCGETTFVLRANHVFMFYINQPHCMSSSQPIISIAFRLSKDYIQSKHLYFEKIPFEHRIYTIDELVRKYHQVPLIMSQLILLMKSRQFDSHIHYKIIGYYNMFLHDLYTVRRKVRYLDIKKKNYDTYLIRYTIINDYIKNNIHKKIKLSYLASLVDISPTRLSHFMHEILGVSLQEYITTIKTERALILLRNTSLPVAEIVKECGFSDQKYLNQEIKKRFHISALTYRKIMIDNLHFGIVGFNYPKMVEEMSLQLHMLQHHEALKDDIVVLE